MLTKNPSFENLKPVKTPDVLNKLKERLLQTKRSLFDYYSYKQVSKSVYIFSMHTRSFGLFFDGLAVLGLIEFRQIRTKDFYQVKEQLIKDLKDHHFSRSLILAVERSSTAQFENKYNWDDTAWMDRWEKECSLMTMAIYFLESCILYAETEDKRNFHLMLERY